MVKNVDGVKLQNLNFKALNSSELAFFFEQLSTFSGSGIATWESLGIISEHSKDQKNKSLFDALYDMVSGGNFLSIAMDKCGCFPDYAIGLIEVGEQTGRIREVSETLCEFYKSKDRLSESIRSSITYPLCMSAMVLVVVFVLLVQVMPVFEQVFSQLGLGLNSVSLFLLNLGQTLNNSVVYIFGVLVTLVIIGFALRFTAGGRKILSNLYDKAPLTGMLSDAENANRFAFSMSLMLGSGLDALNALEFSMLITESERVNSKIKTIITEFEKGESLTDAIIISEIFKPMYNGMLVAGMRSGSVEEMFMSISERYYEDAERYTQRMLSIIEPSLVAVLCIIVGMVMLSVMLPLTGILAGM